MLKIRLTRSKIGITPNQRRTLEALGLRKMNQQCTMESNQSTLGMIAKVKHLVEVVEQ
jgi:large subunit ribosomal protein L30